MTQAKTLFEKIWERHVVSQEPGSPAVLYVDLHLIHEVTSPQAFSGLRRRGLKVRRPEKTVATIDHAVPTLAGLDGAGGRLAFADDMALRQIRQLEENCSEFAIHLYGLDDPNQGIPLVDLSDILKEFKQSPARDYGDSAGLHPSSETR